MHPLQQQQFGIEFEKELEKITLSWSNELKEWYPIAKQALNFASIPSLQISSQKYDLLFQTEKQGLNMNVVAALANNIEKRSPDQMGYDAEGWRYVIELNNRVGASWEALAAPVRQVVEKRIELMGGKKAGLKPIIAEA